MSLEDALFGVRETTSATWEDASIAWVRKKSISSSILMLKPSTLPSPGQFGPPGTNGVPLWYMSQVASCKATLDLNNRAACLDILFFPPGGFVCNSRIASSRSEIINLATSFLGLLFDSSINIPISSVRVLQLPISELRFLGNN